MLWKLTTMTDVHTSFGKVAHLVDSINLIRHFYKILTACGNLCIWCIVVQMIIEIIVMYPVQHRMNREYLDSSYMDSPRFRKASQGQTGPLM